MTWVVCAVVALLLAVAHHTPPQAAAQPTKPAADEFGKTVVPFLESYCYGCHNHKDNAGGVSLEGVETAAHAKKDRKTWEMVERVLMDGSMPPKARKKQPTKDEKSAVAAYLGGKLLNVSCVGPKDAGRVTMRRLNRAEYNNTVRDLCGVDNFRPADDFPSDDVGYGFDNIGDVLSVQPILVEKYMAAADKVLETALRPLPPVTAAKNTFRPQNLLAFPRGSKTNENGKNRILLTAETSSAYMDKLNFPLDGEYAVRAKVWAIKAGNDPSKAVIRVDGKDLQTFEVSVSEDKATVIEFKGKFAAGEKRVAVSFANPFTDKTGKEEKKRTLGVDFLEVEGPLGQFDQPQTRGRQLILGDVAKETPKDKKAAAEKVLSAFARRAYRRPVTKDETARLVKLFELADGKGDKFEEAIKLPLKAVLCSPHYLFRVEGDPKPPATNRTLNDHELAVRLSYFLWSSMPDDELFAAAEKGELRKPAVLQAQVKRMLADWKAMSLTQDFAGQWLMLRSVWGVQPDSKLFPAFDDKLKASMVRETEEYFAHIVKNDRSVMEFLDSDYTILDERLAKHYGVKGVVGEKFREVKLTDGKRGGVLTHASVLTVTSNPTRTSPVKRGKWVLENLLASPPPPAPPNVPELEKTALTGTLRQQMEQHRANPSCAGCHEKMDAIGFGLENFDAIGGWRDSDGKNKVDASGVLPGNQKFDGPAELRKILMTQGDKFRRCLAEKLLTFALGRGLEYYDKCVLDDLVTKLKGGSDRFSALVLAVVQSEPFQQRNAKRSD
jgi:mono/diheme cytochrome c family protein